MNWKAGILYLVLLIQVGCAPSNPRFGSADSISSTPVDELLEAAIRHAVVEEKDIPDYHLIKNKRRIVLQSTRGPLFEWSSEPIEPIEGIEIAVAPQYPHVEIVLASPAEIKELAEARGDFLYLVVGNVNISGDTASVELVLEWAQSTQSRQKQAYLSGGGYEMSFQRREDRWVFARATRGWQY